MRCPECRYDLRETNSERCPECGSALSAEFLDCCANCKTGLVIWAVRPISLVALALSAYLSWITLSGSLTVGCGCQGGCDGVLASKWSLWLWMPVSLPGAGVFAFVFLGSILADSRMRLSVRRFGWDVLVFCSSIVGWAAVWFVALQALVLESFCPYCLATHACGFLTTALVLPRVMAAPVLPPRVGESLARAVRRGHTTRSFFAAGLVVALCAATQYSS